jgi:ABC-2 type transport system permease protein
VKELRLYAAAAGAIFERDARVFLSYRVRVVSQFSTLLLTLAIFYYVSRLVEAPSFASPDAYFAFVATGVLTAWVLQAALSAPTSFRQELVAGTFERSLVSPLGPVGLIVTSLLFPIALALVVAITGFVGAAAIFDLPVTWAQAPSAIPVALLGATAFAGVALLMVACVVAFKQSPGVGLVLAAISITAGVYFPTDLLPGWLRWMGDVQPFTPAVDLLRHLLIGASPGEEPLAALIKLVAFTAVLLPLGAWVVSLAVDHGRRRGTILEY